MAAASAVLLVAGCSRDARPQEATATGDTYEVTHQFGTTVIPVDAVDRTVVTFVALMDAAMAVDVVPVASAMSYQGFPAYLPDVEVVNLGEDEDMDLELIGQQNPGLILVNVQEGAAVEDTPYEEMSRIAPTVPIVTGQHDFEKVALQVGRALNREAEMGEVKRGYDERAAAVADELAGLPEARLPVSQLRLREDNVRVMMERSNAGRVMAAAGLTFEPMLAGAQMNNEAGAFYETSLELLPEAAGEHVFVYSTDEGVVEKTKRMPVWQQLSSVRNGTVHEVDFEHWMRGQGYLAAHAVLDDIERAYGVGAS